MYLKEKISKLREIPLQDSDSTRIELDRRPTFVQPFTWSIVEFGLLSSTAWSSIDTVWVRTWLVDSPGLLIVDQQVARRAGFDCRQLKQLKSLASSLLGRMSFL